MEFEEKEAFEAALPNMLDLWAESMAADGKGDAAQATVSLIRENN